MWERLRPLKTLSAHWYVMLNTSTAQKWLSGQTRVVHVGCGDQYGDHVYEWIVQQETEGAQCVDLIIVAATLPLKMEIASHLAAKRPGLLPSMIVLGHEDVPDERPLHNLWWWVMNFLHAHHHQVAIPVHYAQKAKLADDMVVIFEEWLSDQIMQPDEVPVGLLPERIQDYISLLYQAYDQLISEVSAGKFFLPDHKINETVTRILEHTSVPVLVVGTTASMGFMRTFIEGILSQERGWALLPARIQLSPKTCSPSHPDYVFSSLLEKLGRPFFHVLPPKNMERSRLLAAVFSDAHEFSRQCDDAVVPMYAGLENLTITRVASSADLEHSALAAYAHAACADEYNRKLYVLGPDQAALARVTYLLMRHGAQVTASWEEPFLTTNFGMTMRLILDLVCDIRPAEALCQLVRLLFGHDHDMMEAWGVIDTSLRRDRGRASTKAVFACLDHTQADQRLIEIRDQVLLLHEKKEPGSLRNALDLLLTCLSHWNLAPSPQMGAALEVPSSPVTSWHEVHRQLHTHWNRQRIPVSLCSDGALDGVKVFVSGTLSSRHIVSGHVFLVGLEEGCWPVVELQRGGLSRPLRAQMSLKPPNWRLSLQAHDFALLMMAPHVHMVVHKEKAAVPQIVSRYIQRLEAMAVLNNAHIASLEKTAKALALKRREVLSQDKKSTKASPPHPQPPVTLRPQQLSITEIETWVRDPYRIYVRHVLGLEELDPHHRPWDQRDTGTMMHRVLECYFCGQPVSKIKDEWRRKFEYLCLAPMMQRYLNDYVARVLEAAVAEDGWINVGDRITENERKVSSTFNGQHGSLTVKGRLDRIDCTAQQALRIIDYKTGYVPTKNELLSFMAPQLLVSALILEDEGADVCQLTYIQLPDDHLKGISKQTINEEDLGVVLPEARQRLLARIDLFSHEKVPYKSRVAPRRDVPTFDLVEQLARVGEWYAGDQDG